MTAIDQTFVRLKTNLSNTASDVGGVINKTAAPVKDFIKNATSLFSSNKQTNTPSLNYRVNDIQQKQSPIVKNFVQTAQKGIQNWAVQNPARAQNIIDAPSNFSQSVTEPIASVPFNRAKNKINLERKKLFVIPEKTLPKMPAYVPQSRQYPEQFQTPAPNMSFVPEDQLLIQRESNPELEAIKQRILSGKNVRPSVKEYLSDVPINYSPSGLDNRWAGASLDAGNPYREIQINEDILKTRQIETAQGVFRPETKQETTVRVDRTLNDTIKHELLHQTPNLVPEKLFQPRNQKVINEYSDRWGKKYFNNPKTQELDTDRLVGEMFAEEALPPIYYWHIFKKVVPQAKPINFIQAIKSYFSNNINNPQPETEITPQFTNSLIPFNQRVNRGVPGTPVSIGGGQPVSNQ